MRLFLALLLVGCGGDVPAAQRGASLFVSPSFSPEASNVFACSTCHATTASGDANRILPGYTLADVTARPSWWGGAYDRLLDAVNECYVEFMRGPPLTPDDTDGRELLVYLESLSPDASAPALPLTIVKNIAAACASDAECAPTQKCVPDPQVPSVTYCDLPPGDATRGADTYQRACAYCHGDAHTGAGRLGPNVSIIPEDSIAAHGTDPRKGARAIAIEKTRHGRFFAVGGNMAPYSLEAISDPQIADILAHLGL